MPVNGRFLASGDMKPQYRISVSYVFSNFALKYQEIRYVWGGGFKNTPKSRELAGRLCIILQGA